MQKGTAHNMKGDGNNFELKDFQLVNHFYKHSFITSKVGLTQSLKNLKLWSNEIPVDCFYPRCFNINSSRIAHESQDEGVANEVDNFRDQFRLVAAQSILKRFIMGKPQQHHKLLVALNVCEKSLYSLDEILEHYKEVRHDHVCSDTEWSVLSQPKSSFNDKKVKEIESKKWFQVI